jgi:hypothetical protein
MPSLDIPAIDVHGHYGDYVRRGDAGDNFYSASAEEVVRRAAEVNVVLTIVSPLSALLPRFQADAVAGNREAAEIVPKTPGLPRGGPRQMRKPSRESE